MAALDDLRDRLEAVLVAATGVTAPVRALRRLSGGASRETFAFDVAGRQLVLRRDPPGAPRSGTTMGLEAALLRAAAAAGAPVPGVVVASDDPHLLGAPFVVMGLVEGETIPRRILRDDAFATARPRLAGQCGRIVACIQRIDPDAVGGLEHPDPVGQYREVLDQLGEPHPALELGFRWLEGHRPFSSGPPVVVHGDFRNGNLVVGPDGIRAVLDWELAHLGDPMEDLGWLCVRAWRFGVDQRVGGFGSTADLVGSYEAESGRTVDLDALRWWETMGTLRWAVMCVMQAAVHLTGMVRSVELATIGRRVCESEWDLLNLIDGSAPDLVAATEPGDDGAAVSVHDRPTAAELVEAVRAFLEEEVRGSTEGRTQFHVRVAANALGIVQRELRRGAEPSAAHVKRLLSLGVANDAELAAAIRAGRLADRARDVTDVVRAAVAEKLTVANPSYAGALPGGTSS